MIEGFEGTGKAYVQISGLWIYGNNTSIREDSPFNAPALVAWKEPIQNRVLADRGIRVVVPISGTAYGDSGGGIPGLVLGSPRDDAGDLVMLGDGKQHWATVHVADLADFFTRALENESAQGYYVIANGIGSTVAELTEAAAVAVGAPGAVPGSDDEARARLGDYFAEVLLLDQATNAAKARDELGWNRPISRWSTSSSMGVTASDPLDPVGAPSRVEARRTGRGVPAPHVTCIANRRKTMFEWVPGKGAAQLQTGREVSHDRVMSRR